MSCEAEMRAIARQIFDLALAESSIEKAFQRHMECDRSVLRIGKDLYDLNSYSRVFVTSIGKAAHSLVEALQRRCGDRFEGIVASSTEAASQLRGFRYFQGGHPMPNGGISEGGRGHVEVAGGTWMNRPWRFS